MSRLPSEPRLAPRSAEEVIGIARQMADLAAGRYGALALRLRAAGCKDAADSLGQLAVNERRDAADLARRLPGDPQSGTPIPAVADSFDDEGMGQGAPLLQTRYRVFAMAVRNKERAFALWTYVAANAAAAAVSDEAEQLGRAALAAAKALRVARRRAFHEERAERLPNMAPFGLVEAERAVGDALTALGRGAAPDAAPRFEALASASYATAEALSLQPLHVPPLRDVPAITDTEALAEWLADHYLAAADTLKEQPARDRAQRLAEAAIERVAFLARGVAGRP